VGALYVDPYTTQLPERNRHAKPNFGRSQRRPGSNSLQESSGASRRTLKLVVILCNRKENQPFDTLRPVASARRPPLLFEDPVLVSVWHSTWVKTNRKILCRVFTPSRAV
jgi:hypothetical protein